MTHTRNDFVVLHLHLIKGVGPATIAQLIASAGPDFSYNDLYSASVLELAQLCKISERKARVVHEGLSDSALLEKEQALIKKYNILWMSSLDLQYPKLLASIHAPPPIVYWQGNIQQNWNRSLAVVGSRKATEYGYGVVESFVPELVNDGWCIVSGGAFGIDGMAHKAAVQAQGRTVVVLGSGLLRPYPQQHIDLFKKVVASGGALISAFPVQTDPAPGNFPARNRIISGISRATLVVQAAQKSGARITAQYALDQGRDVFAVPGPIDHPLSAGCHGLIQEGAHLVTSVEDIITSCGLQRSVMPAITEKVASMRTEHTQEVRIKKVDAVQDTSPQGKIIALCKKPVSTDDLLEATGFEFAQLNSHLCDLQIDGVIEQTSAGKWQLIK